jgi:YD repeat-containing protein
VRRESRSLILCVACCFAGAVGSPALASASGTASKSPSHAKAANEQLREAALVVPGVQALDGAQQVQDQREAVRMNPQAAVKREDSQSEYEGLDGEEAAKLDEEAFPETITEPEGGPPELPPGEKITEFPSEDVASVSLGGGQHAVLESAEPMAVEASPGHLTPVNLELAPAEGGYHPTTPAVEVFLPKRLSDGAQLPTAGLSITPVDAGENPLVGSEGTSNGASVLYANTETDTDTDIKPAPTGVSADTILRSIESPEKVSFQLGLPSGAHLEEGAAGSDELTVVDEGAAIAAIPPPTAHDAAGTPVPVTMSVDGNDVVLSVAHKSDSYQYPILVDPELQVITDTKTTNRNWIFYQEGSSSFSGEAVGEHESVLSYVHTPEQKGAYGVLAYSTKGTSKIYEFRGKIQSTEDQWNSEGLHFHEDYVQMFGNGAVENTQNFGGAEEASFQLCASGGCSPTSGAEHNAVVLVLLLTGNYYEYGAGTRLQEPAVAIAQPKETHATVGYNTTSAEVDGTINVLHPVFGQNGWLGPQSGAFEAVASDAGLGVSATQIEGHKTGGWEVADQKNDLLGVCAGVQCPPSIPEVFTWSTLSGFVHLPDGEDTVRYAARDPLPSTWSSEHGEGEVKLKVDATPPTEIKLIGLNPKEELGEGTAQFRAQATDATSGVYSIEALVDGKSLGAPSAGCPAGPCTAEGGWSINGTELGAGVHVLTLLAKDRAGNIAEKNYDLGVDHASPISIGPGSVNPESGDLALDATDVNISGGLGALTLTRSYDSRQLRAGAFGVFGPEWNVSLLGNLATLETLPDKSVMVIGPDGLTHFALKSGGGFEPPEGDKSLTLESVLNSKGEVSEYLVKDPTQGTTTRFTEPSGSTIWMPTVSEGPVATDTVTDSYTTAQVEGHTVVEPTEELAPHPSLSCEPLARGCRALLFTYAHQTTAQGENETEWGEYTGRLVGVSLDAYNPSTKSMKQTEVASYAYDSEGRLRAEWDPRISPALKTIYGYDAENHVTAVSAPGQQPWLLSYETLPNDSSTGRLGWVTRPPASTELGKKAPHNTSLPKLSSEVPENGKPISVTTGAWSSAPLTYAYRWETCTTANVCTVIPGASSSTYTPIVGNSGFLRATVTALNAIGAVAASSAHTSGEIQSGSLKEEPVPAPPNVGSNSVWTMDYHVPVSGSQAPYQLGQSEVAAWGQKDDPEEATAVFPPDEPMGSPAADYKRATIYYRDEHARTVNVARPSGGITTQEYNAQYDLVRSLSPDNRAAALSEGSHSAEVSKELDTESTYDYTGTELQETKGPQHTVELSSGPKVTARDRIRYFYDEGAPKEGAYDLVTKVINGAEYMSGTKVKEADDRETVTGYNWGLRKPTSVTEDPSGLDSTRTTKYDSAGQVVETRTPRANAPGKQPALEGDFKGTETYELCCLGGLAVTSKGSYWATDFNKDRVINVGKTGKLIAQFGSAGSGTGQFHNPGGIALDSSEDVWVADTGNSRIQELNKHAELLHTWGSAGSGSGQFLEPRGVAVDHHNLVWVADAGNARLDVLNTQGEVVKVVGTRGSGPGQFEEPDGITVDEEGHVWVDDGASLRIEEFNEAGEFISQFSIAKYQPKDGLAKRLTVFDGSVWVADAGRGVDQFTTSGQLVSTLATTPVIKGKTEPVVADGLGVDPKGELIVGNRATEAIERWMPAQGQAKGNKEARDTKTIYYTAGPESEVSACANHPEWVGLPCQTQPEQPEVTGMPILPTTTVTYNMLDEPETAVEEFGSSAKRVLTRTFDAAGRQLTSEVTGTTGLAVPKLSDKYDSSTGALASEASEGETGTHTISNVVNTLGQLTSYTDAQGATSKYAYDVDDRVSEVNFGSIGGSEATQSYSYDPTSGELTKLIDSGAGTFTASYDVGGQMVSESYPNGMTAEYGYNQVGQQTSIEYIKKTHCTESKGSCRWYQDEVIPSIHGETMSQSSTLADYPRYSYDEAGRLTEVAEKPTGEGCTTRSYEYDEEGDRTSLTTAPPNEKGACTTAHGTTEEHAYDTGNRLIDSGTAYDSFGNATRIPAADAGGAELSNSYYADNQLASESQSGKQIAYIYDAAGRVSETRPTGAATVVSHYAGPGGAVAWSVDGSGKWMRNIPAIDGGLAAVEEGGSVPVIELHDLKGDVVATAADEAGTETKLLSTYVSTEFGVPTTESPPRYSWLGTAGVSSELSSGVVAQAGNSYVPKIGRITQSEGVQPPANNVTPYTSEIPPWVAELLAAGAAQRTLAAEEAERARREADKPPSFGEGTPEGEGGGPEYEDPGILWWKATEERARMFEHWAKTIGETCETFHCDNGSGAWGILYDSAELDEKAAKELFECAHNVKNKTPDGVCWIEYNYTTFDWLGVGYFDILLTFGTEPCYWVSGNIAKHEWFECPGQGKYAG